MGWDGTGMNCYGMEWDRKICPMDKPENTSANILEWLFRLSDGVDVVKCQVAQISIKYSFQTNPFFQFMEKNFFFYCVMSNHICSIETVN